MSSMKSDVLHLFFNCTLDECVSNFIAGLINW